MAQVKSSFHEDYDRAHEVKSGSDRGFGLTVGGILLLIAGVRAGFHWAYGAPFGWLTPLLATAGIVLLGLAAVAPQRLSGPHRAWIKLGLVLFKVVNPIVLGLIYLTTVVPTGLIMRALGRDSLGLKFDRTARTYWIERDPPGPAPDTMTNQF
jgi:hypothetical protein